MATSKVTALEALLKFLKEDAIKQSLTFYHDRFKQWEGATVDNLPDDYYIMEYNEGEILVSEVS